MEIRMSDQKRIDAVQAASDGRLEKRRCGEVLGVTVRQVNRLIGKLRLSCGVDSWEPGSGQSTSDPGGYPG